MPEPLTQGSIQSDVLATQKVSLATTKPPFGDVPKLSFGLD
jgi:hypothetical protein